MQETYWETSSVKTESDTNTEILEESVTSSGVQYVISRFVPDDENQPVEYFLYYGYESVVYEWRVTVRSSEEENIIAEDLKRIADTLQITYPN